MVARTRRKALAVLLAVALTLGAIGQTVAVKTESDHVTEGHVNYVTASNSFSGCFAGVAGLVLQRVTWFNGQELFRRAAGGGHWVYLTEHFNNDGAGFDQETGIRIKNPTNEKLFRTNNTYRFTDPEPESDVTWVVEEYFALRDQRTSDANVGGGGIDGEPKRVYVFVVKVAEDVFTESTQDRRYNFVSLVDTCRFHSSSSGGMTHKNGTNNGTGQPIDQHQEADEDGGSHFHQEYSIDVWIGDAPDAVPLTEETGGVPDDNDNTSSATDDAASGGP